MKIRFVVPVFAALAIASIAGAQGVAAKVAVVDFQGAIASTGEGKEALAQMQAKFAPREAEMAKLQKEIEDLNGRLRTGDKTLSDDEKTRIQQQIDQDTRTGQREQTSYQEDVSAEEQGVVQNIGRKMLDVISNYAKDNGYTLVLDRSSQQTNVVWAADSTDISTQVVALYDSKNPVKASSAPASGPKTSAPSSAPSAPKPSTPGTTAPKPSGTGAAPKPQ